MAGLTQATPAAADDPVAMDGVSPPVAAAGITVVLAGHGFSLTAAENVVGINGVAATVVAATASQLDVAVPAGATSGPVTVQTLAGSATSSSDLYIPPATFTVSNVETTQRLVYGTAATAVVGTSGKISLLTIPGQAGHQLSLKLTGSTFGSSTSNARAAVYRPDGTALISPTGFATAGIFFDPVAPAVDGTYQVLIDPQSTAVGQVVVTAYDVPDNVAVPATPDAGLVVVTTTVPGQNGVVTSGATTGQRLYFSFSAGTFSSASNARVSVHKPDGTTLIAAASCGTSCSFDAVMPVTGTYTILVDPRTSWVGSLTVRLYDVAPDVSAAVTADGPAVTVTTTTPGQNATLTFAGTSGERLYFSFTGGTFSSSSNTTLAVRRPDDSSYVSAMNCGVSCFIDTRTLPVTGTYTIFFDPQGGVIGSLTAMLYEVPTDAAVTAVPGGSAVTITNTVPGQTRIRG